MSEHFIKPKKINEVKVAVIGLGYVGLPLAIEFAKHYDVVGFDIAKERIQELKQAKDSTLEVQETELKQSSAFFTTEVNDISACNVYIVTVPTPIDENNKPDLSALIHASRLVAQVLKAGDFVVYESTVYPGATEEVCVPELERSGLKFNLDFYVGYSPERINPGDKNHRLINISKVVSASQPDYAKFIEKLYKKVIEADIHLAQSIKVAEAAKVIENTQRDLNIALINELSQIFNLLDIDTEAVLKAASTKWNFHAYQPGLVGGHCIGVDPYYLTHKAQSIGYEPKVILAGRSINDSMSNYVAKQFINLVENKNPSQKNQTKKLLVCGLTFKENCPDTRNSKVFDLIASLIAEKNEVEVWEPWVNPSKLNQHQPKIAYKLVNRPTQNYDGIIIAVAHQVFKDYGIEEFKKSLKEKGAIYDLKFLFPKEQSDLRL